MGTPAIRNNLWSRKGIFYYAKMNVYRNHQFIGTIVKRLDFVSYHMIRWYHGDGKLAQMAVTRRLR